MWVLLIALILSIAVHLPIYGALGVLAKFWAALEAQRQPPPVVEVEFDVALPSEETESTTPSEEAASPGEAEPADPERVAEREREEERAREQPREAERQEERVAVPTPQPEQQRQPPPQERANLQSITQRSRDPNVQPPPDARFLARESQRVEEETVAQIRNYQRDDEMPAAAAPEEPSESQEEGDSDEQEVADLREMEGTEARDPTPEEATARRPREAPEHVPAREVRQEEVARGREGSEGDGATASPQREVVAGAAQAREGGGAETETEVVEVFDGVGTIRIERPRALGRGAGENGGVTVAGEAEPRPGSQQRTRRRGIRGSGSGAPGSDLRLSWSQFEEVYGRERLDEEREQYVRERRSRARGQSHQERWQEFRAAIENFTPNVRPGNQTALNAAASPFAEYMAEVHRRLHRHFADRFLARLPGGGLSPMGDRTLMTKLEIIINRDGSVHRVGIVHTSGFLPFDHGAYASVMRGQPYPEAPGSILSGDGRVYLHWGFYRNERQCGTFNAEPYILPNPPGTPAPGGGTLRDEPEWGGVVPDDARPTMQIPRGRGGDGVDGPAPRESAPPAPGEGGEGGGGGNDDGRERERERDPAPPPPGGAGLG